MKTLTTMRMNGGDASARHLMSAAFLIWCVLGVSACGSATSYDRTTAASPPVTTPRISDGDEAYGDVGLNALNEASQLTIAGTVISSLKQVEIGFDEDFDPKEVGVKDPISQEYTLYEVRVDEVLRGKYEAGTLTVAYLTHLGGNAVASSEAAVPDGVRGVWLLAPIAAEFDLEGYVLTGSSSSITQVETRPLTISGDSATLARDIAQYTSIDEVVAALRP